MKSELSVIVFLICLSLFGCISDVEEIQFEVPFSDDDCVKIKQSGVVISFDDRKNIDAWNQSRELFQKYNIKATFFVDKWHTLNESEISILSNLSFDGHEIGYHTGNHSDYFKYLENNLSARDYYELEVLPGIETMKNYGFHPTSFAYPNGHRDNDIDALLFANFSSLRGTRTNVNGSNHWMTDCANFDVYRSYHFPHSDLNESDYQIRNITIQSNLEKIKNNGTSIFVINGHGIVSGGFPVSDQYLTDFFKYLNEEKIPTLLFSELK